MLDTLIHFFVFIFPFFAGAVFLVLFLAWLTCRFIPTDRVGIVEKLWSGTAG